MNFERTERFKRAFKKLSLQQRERFEKAIHLFADDPRHASLGVKRVQGTADVWEGRVDLKVRFTFQWVEGGIRLRNIDDHDACLRNP